MTGKIWLPVGVLVIAVGAQIFALRSKWVFDTQRRPDLQTMAVRSGYSLLLENPGDRSSEPLLQYQASSTHNHRVTVEMSKSKLSKETRTYISQFGNPPEGTNQLTFAPDTSAPGSGAPCRAMFFVEFPSEKTAEDVRSVRLYPPTPSEFNQPDKMRVIHLEGSSPIRIRISSNSTSKNDKGPGCRQLLTFGPWHQVMGPDTELGFVADPGSRVTITLSPDPKTEGAFRAGSDEIDSLMIKPLSPRRLSIGPYGMSQPAQVRERAGQPFLSIRDLALRGDSFELQIAGMAGIPIPEVLGAWKWLLLAGINVPLIVWTGRAALARRPRRWMQYVQSGVMQTVQRGGLRIFLSYSWEDKDNVMPIYKLLKSLGADPWIDREKIRGGAEWELSIKEQMRQSQRVIIFLSSDSVRKAGFAWAEIRIAVHIADEQPEGTVFIIPVRLDECKLPDLLSRWNCIDLYGPDGKQKLLQSLGLDAEGQSTLVQRSAQ